MVHAIEAYTSRVRKNPLSDALAREALRLLAGNIHHVCDPAKTGDKGKGERKARRRARGGARGALVDGRCSARRSRGWRLRTRRSPPSGGAGVPARRDHDFRRQCRIGGARNSLMLPHVLDFNAADDTAAVCSTPSSRRSCAPAKALRTGARALVSRLAEGRTRSGCRRRCATWASPRATSACSRVEAMKFMTRLLPNNPREVALRDAEASATLRRAAF